MEALSPLGYVIVIAVALGGLSILVTIIRSKKTKE